MITAEGKCDGKCSTCNIVQQAYCKLVQFETERLDKIEASLTAIEKRLDSELIIAQGGDGAEKVTEI